MPGNDDEEDLSDYPWYLRDLIDKISPTLFPDIEPESPRKVTYVLGGGGAKGCFQAGALGFLAEVEEEEDLQPDLICGTSVGALNGILATENANTRGNERIIDLLNIWLGLENRDDFFVVSPAVRRFDEDLPDWLQNLTNVTWENVEEAAISFFGAGYNLHPDEIPEPYVIEGSGPLDILEKTAIFGGAATLGNLPGGFLVGGAAFKIIANGLEEDFEEAKNIQSLFSLSPVRELLRENIYSGNLQVVGDYSDEAALNLDRTLLRMVSVDVRTGNVCWVNNRGQFNILKQEKLTDRVYGNPIEIETYDEVYGSGFSTRTGGRRVPLDFFNTIIKGALSSASIPAAFPPQSLYLTDKFDYEPESAVTLYDGGVKEVLPTQAAKPYLVDSHDDDFENYVVTISNQPMFDNARFFQDFESDLSPTERPDTYDPEPKYWDLTEQDIEFIWGEDTERSGTNLLELVARAAISLQGQEIRRSDTLDLLAAEIPLKQLVVAPTFSVNETTQIDVGLTRIALAYGWMRACDMIFLKHRQELFESESLSARRAFTPFFDAYHLTDLIIRLRMNCWRIEMRVTPIGHEHTYYDVPYFEPDVIDQLRETKREIADKIADRKALLRSFPHPEFPKSEYMMGETPNEWLDFEPHSPESFWSYHEGLQEETEETIEFMADPGQLWGDDMFERGSGFLPSATRPTIP